MPREREIHPKASNLELLAKRTEVLTRLLQYDEKGRLLLGGKQYIEGNKWFLERVIHTYLSRAVSYAELYNTLEKGYDAPEQLIRNRLNELRPVLQGENLALQFMYTGEVVDHLNYETALQVIDSPSPKGQAVVSAPKAAPATEPIDIFATRIVQYFLNDPALTIEEVGVAVDITGPSSQSRIRTLIRSVIARLSLSSKASLSADEARLYARIERLIDEDFGGNRGAFMVSLEERMQKGVTAGEEVIEEPVTEGKKEEEDAPLSKLELIYVAGRLKPLPRTIRDILRPFRRSMHTLFVGKTSKAVREYQTRLQTRARAQLINIEDAYAVWENFHDDVSLQKVIEYLHEQFVIEKADVEKGEVLEDTQPSTEERTARRVVRLEDIDKRWDERIQYILDRLPSPDSETGLIRSTQLIRPLHIKLVRWNDAVEKLYTGETRGHHEALLPEEAAQVVYYAKYGRALAQRGIGPRAIKVLFPQALKRKLAPTE